MKTTYTKSRPETIFQLLTFTFDPFFNVKWGYLTTKALYLLYFSIITDSKAGDSRCGSGLVYSYNGNQVISELELRNYPTQALITIARMD